MIPAAVPNKEITGPWRLSIGLLGADGRRAAMAGLEAREGRETHVRLWGLGSVCAPCGPVPLRSMPGTVVRIWDLTKQLIVSWLKTFSSPNTMSVRGNWSVPCPRVFHTQENSKDMGTGMRVALQYLHFEVQLENLFRNSWERECYNEERKGWLSVTLW